MGPEAVISILTGSNIASLLDDGSGNLPDVSVMLEYTITLTLMIGLITLGLGLVRFGFLDNVLSRPLLSAFITAVGCLIVIEQLDVLFGFEPNVTQINFFFKHK